MVTGTGEISPDGEPMNRTETQTIDSGALKDKVNQLRQELLGQRRDYHTQHGQPIQITNQASPPQKFFSGDMQPSYLSQLMKRSAEKGEQVLQRSRSRSRSNFSSKKASNAVPPSGQSQL